MGAQSLRRYVSLALLVLTMLPAFAVARGKNPTSVVPDPRDKVKQLTQEGASALLGKDFPAATRALSAAYRLAPTSELLSLLGQLALAEGRIVDAKDLFRRYLNDTPEPETSPGRAEAQRVLQLPGPPPGEMRIVGDRNSLVLVDDRVVGTLPLPLPLLLPAGEHKVVLEQNALRLEDRITVLAGRVAELRCQYQLGVVVVSYPPALLLLSDYPGLGGEPQQKLERAVAQAVTAAHLDVLSRAAALVQAPTLGECLGTLGCQSELATQNLVPNALNVKVAMRAGSTADWELQVGLLDASVKELAATQSQECLACSPEQVAALLAQMVAEVLKMGLGRPHGTLAIATTPPGAEVFAGPRSLGVTPLSRAQFVGPLDVTVRLPGYRSHPASVAIASGQTATVKLTLVPGSDVVLPPPTVTKTVILPRPRWRLGVGGAALGVGIGIVALGISAFAVNNQCVPDSYKGPDCQNVYMTTGIGTGLGIGGALLIGGGVVLLALPGQRHQIVVPAEVPPSAAADGRANGPL